VAEVAEQATNDVLEKPAKNEAELARQWNAEISTANGKSAPRRSRRSITTSAI
jgi:hypothetical protein